MSAVSQRYVGLWDDVEPENSRRLLLAALDAFADRGFHAATTRDIARRAGMSPAAVYVHYRSKTELLSQIARVGHAAVLAEVRRALESPGTPGTRLYRFVEAFAHWHAEFHTLARVIQYEIRSLPPAELIEVRGMRRQFQEIVEQELRDGVAAGEFVVDDIPGTGLAILSLSVDIARWYSAKRSRSEASVATLYAHLVLRMVQRVPEQDAFKALASPAADPSTLAR